MMKVKELINLLENYHDEQEVVLSNDSEGISVVLKQAEPVVQVTGAHEARVEYSWKGERGEKHGSLLGYDATNGRYCVIIR